MSIGGTIPIGLNTYCLRGLKWNDAQLLDYAASLKLDAVFLQDSLDPAAMEPAHWKEVREHADRLGLHLETGGAAILPRNAEDFAPQVARLRKNIERAKIMGSPIVRALLAGDRAHFPPGTVEQHIETAIRQLREVRQQALDAGLKIAIENHKDLHAWETRAVIEGAGTDFVGSYLDTGNPVFIFEDPMTTIETLGPLAVSVHLRDSCVYEVARGAAVQWVVLGDGVNDFRQIVQKVREVCPPVYIYIKPITGRPPVVMPYLDPEIWKVYPRMRGSDLARFIALAKCGHPYDGRMVVEEIPGTKTPPEYEQALATQQKADMERSVEYAKKALDLGKRWRS